MYVNIDPGACACGRARACVRACVHSCACVRVCVRACVCACVRACVRAFRCTTGMLWDYIARPCCAYIACSQWIGYPHTQETWVKYASTNHTTNHCSGFCSGAWHVCLGLGSKPAGLVRRYQRKPKYLQVCAQFENSVWCTGYTTTAAAAANATSDTTTTCCVQHRGVPTGR